MSAFFETIMLICFGLSWPISVHKSWTSRTAKGKSVFFAYAIIIGYICGILGKFTAGNVNYVLVLYVLNTLMVATDVVLYYRNKKLDQLGEKE